MTTYQQTAIEAAFEAELAHAASGGSNPPAHPAPAPAPGVTPPAPPAPRPRTAAETQRDALVVRDRIKALAQTAARTARSVDTASKFYKRLTDYYLTAYLASPSPALGVAACETKIGKAFAGPATPGDSWEAASLSQWNHQPIPASARMLRPALPAELAAATDILSRSNRAKLPYIDVPHLIGSANMGTGFDADVAGGGKNISQLMHWGTGVKYSHLGARDMRELFLAYEMWHLEAWDVFGEDPINDMIAEEAGRILGVGLRAGTVTRANLQSVLNAGFGEARAWVGSLLRARLTALDAWTVAPTQARANIWWGAQPAMDVWGSDTLVTMLQRGMTLDAVTASPLAQRIVGIYTLVYETPEWERTHAPIVNGPFIDGILAGSYDSTFRKLANGQSIISLEADAVAQDAPPAPAIEGYRYDATGTTCSGGPTPGATALKEELARRYGGRGEIYNCRPVRGGQHLSLHGEGRAVDWYRSAADPAEAAEAQRIIDWLLATDGAGNQHALARRMGVQEIIWNRRIWSASRHAEGWRDYTGTDPHTSHLHIGLHRAGAARQTSYWTTPPAAGQSVALSGGSPSIGSMPAPNPPAPVAPAVGAPAPATAPAAIPAFRNAADINAWFVAKTGSAFLDWFHATQAGKGAWAKKDVLRDADTRLRFTQFWNGAAANVFGTPTFSLEQFVALQSIFINELGGGLVPIAEKMGRPGHPGMAYLFDAISGVKASYNVAPNKTALQCFNDADFLAAHGTKAPGARLANTTNAAWGTTAWPAGEPTSTSAAPFIAEADFCRFRGRGMIQTTWRTGYAALVRWIQAYTGSNATIVRYRTAWAGQTVERVLSRSSNADWDDLFQHSDYEVPWAGIRLHSAGSGGYLAISATEATRLGKAAGSFWFMGRRISGSGSYGDLFKRRCVQTLTALAAATPPAAVPGAPAGAHEAQAFDAGPPPASGLTWSGGTAEQLAFKRRVYDIQIARSRRVRGFVASVPAAELSAITLPGGGHSGQMRTAAAGAVSRMLEAAATALSDAKARSEQLATDAGQIGVGSAYRSEGQQFTNWNNGFGKYYGETAAARAGAAGGEHGEQAAELTARHIGGILGAPGYSLHNNGLAVDLTSRQGRAALGASTTHRRAWRASWAWSWLTANAASFDLFQNTGIDEPWHWEYRPPAGTAAPTPRDAAAPPAPAPAVPIGGGVGASGNVAAGRPSISFTAGAPAAAALGTISAGEAQLTSVPMLAAHHDRGPDLILRWNAIADLSAGIDVVVHLHGYSADRHLDIAAKKLPLSGLDFVAPTPPAAVHAPTLPAWTPRSRPTLLVLPRGRAVPGSAAAYDFPALITATGFASLIDAALRAFEQQVGVGAGSARTSRIVLTGHSGGGAPLDQILTRTGETPVDPHEVHVFDGLYGRPVGLRGWATRRIRADIAAAATAGHLPGALRVLYLPAPSGMNPKTGRPWTSTEPSSVEIGRHVASLLPAGQGALDPLRARYRIERAGIGHSLIPYWYGGRLLADPAASIPRP